MRQLDPPADNDRPRNPAIDKQLDDFERQLDESTRGAREMTERFRIQAEARERERLEQQKNDAPWWVPVGMLAGLGGIAALLVWLDRRRKAIAREQMQRHMGQAQFILALILEEADDDRIWAAIRALRINPKEKPPFLAAFTIATLTTPIPWYRADVNRWRERIEGHLAKPQ